MEIIITILVAATLSLQIFTFAKTRSRSKIARGSILLDTSAIMDGRIVDVASTGIITAETIIPRSVIRELQLLADKSDADRRARARQGLENIKKLQRLETVAVTIINDGFAEQGVDERLLDLAENYSASLATVDFNLNQVAQTMGITVINVNELAQVLRMNYLPGEKITINITGVGQSKEQGIGHLEDGTMVVVDNARNQIGQKIDIEIVRALQTEAGRMMFAKKVTSQTSQSSPKPSGQGKFQKAPQNRYKKPNFFNKNKHDNKSHSKTRQNYRQSRTPEDSLVETANR